MPAAPTGRPKMTLNMSSSKVYLSSLYLTFNIKYHSEDLDDIPRLRAKLKVPATPPDPATISPAVQRLHTTIAARYVGAGSLITLKTPQEGFMKQAVQLNNIREGYQGMVEKVYRMSGEQRAIFQGGLCSFVNFGGHGSGTQMKCYRSN